MWSTETPIAFSYMDTRIFGANVARPLWASVVYWVASPYTIPQNALPGDLLQVLP